MKTGCPAPQITWHIDHSIRLSDATFTNFVQLASSSSIFYCPNLVFYSAPNAVVTHSNYGYVIGYSYLANAIETTTKGNDYWTSPTKITDFGTNELIADANYWNPNQSAGSFPGAMKVAPHRPMGAAVSDGSSFTVGLNGKTSTDLGAAGGNIGYLDMSVVWRNIKQMQTYSASSTFDGYGNW